MNTMTRTIFWNDATFCVVKFDPTTITSARILCEVLGKPLNARMRDVCGINPTRFLVDAKFWWKDNPSFDSSKQPEVPILEIPSWVTGHLEIDYTPYFIPGYTSETIKDINPTSHRVIPRSAKRVTKKTPPKKVNVKIHWLHERTEIVPGEEHEDPHKTISSALYNGGYSQAAIHSIKHWSINDSLIKYTYNNETYEWEASQ